MKKLLRLFCSVGLVSLLGGGAPVLSSYAGDECPDPHSPLRGAWSYSQVSAVTPLFGNLPDTSVGVLKVDNCGRFQARGIANIPCQDADCFGLGPLGVSNPLEFTFEGQITTHADGTATAIGLVFGGEFRRACVVMEKRGGCFQEFRCVSTDPTPPNAAMLATFKRQLSGSCQ